MCLHCKKHKFNRSNETAKKEGKFFGEILKSGIIVNCEVNVAANHF
jgi:hypothetical protein